MQPAIINTALYPLDNLAAAQALRRVADVRTDLERDGSCLLPDFVNPEILAQMVQQAQTVTHLAYPGPTEVSPYFFNYRLGEEQSYPISTR